MHDRRQVAVLFRSRLAALVARHPGGMARFARDSGIDRSALSQFLDAKQDRLPRAETLVRLARARGASIDWLLGLTNVEHGGQEIASSVEIETALAAGEAPDGASPLARWQREAVGAKIRYVPSGLPDMFRLPAVADPAVGRARADARASHAAGLVADARLRDTDVEICMSEQRLEGLAEGRGMWSAYTASMRRAQLAHMAAECERHYPSIRLHLFDARHTYSAPLTVFGLKRAAIYLGGSYLVVTANAQVRGLARHFDELVRAASVPPHRVHTWLEALAERAGQG